MENDLQGNIQFLMMMSGREEGVCWEMLDLANYDLEMAASLLLGEQSEQTQHTQHTQQNGLKEIKQRHEPVLAEAKEAERIIPKNPVGRTTNPTLVKSPKRQRFTESVLIPQYRLEEAMRLVDLPTSIELKPIDISNAIAIPGGITLCEISSESLESISNFLAVFSNHFAKYSMSICFTIESITKKENRVQFIRQMGSLFYDLLGMDLRTLHHDFQEQAIYQCSVLHGDEEGDGEMEVVGGGQRDTNGNQILHILTITMNGLPELLLLLQEASRTLASSFSLSKLNGSGSLSCVPDEWSLLCHTVPYTLILLEPNGKEWREVLENGKWETKNQKSHVKCIHRVENVELWKAYCTKREQVERSRGGDPNEQWLWHGTRQLSPEVIAREGFDFRVANSGLYGRGAYFAYSINYSANGYQHTIQMATNAQPQFLPQMPHPFHTQPMRQYGGFGPPTQPRNPNPVPNNNNPAPSVIKYPPDVRGGESQVILARVCVGKTANVGQNRNFTRPPDGYDSVTGGDVMSIVYDLSMAYPSYIVTYM